MENICITKIIRVGTSNAIVIPRAILNANNWERGDHVVFTLVGLESLIIKKLNDSEIQKLKSIPDIIA